MKTFSKLIAPQNDGTTSGTGRWKPSGVHRISRPDGLAVDTAISGNTLKPTAAARTTPRAALPAKPPRWHLIASTPVVAAMSVIALAARWFVQSEWACVWIGLVPLAFLLHRAQRAQWSLYAGVLWLVLAELELVRPIAAAEQSQLRGALSLCVLGMILLSWRSAYRGMQELSRRDPLTGLLNRRGFEELGRLELQRAARDDRPIAFALFDVDRFKEINDRYGHSAGDRVLQVVAAQLRALRRSDLGVRLGGDEFGLLMPDTDFAGAELLVARLRQTLHERLREHGWPVTISVGISQPPSAARMDALMDEADQRMYEAKSHAYSHA